MLGAGYGWWVRPNAIINGGVTSLAMIIEQLTRIPIVYLTSGLTAFLLLLCLLFLGKSVFLKSVYSGVCYNLFFAAATLVPISLSTHLVVDFVLASFFIAYGYYFILRENSSTVGLDVLVLILAKKKPSLNIAKTIRYFNWAVLGLGFFVFGIYSIIIGVLFSFANTFILGKLMKSES